MTKNKVHGTISAFLSIVSYSTGSRRILIDYSTQSTAFVCHLKARTMQDFDAWIEIIKQHRLYYQYKCLEQSSFGLNCHAQQSNNNNNAVGGGQAQQVNSSANASNPAKNTNQNSSSMSGGASGLNNSVNRESMIFSNSAAAAKTNSSAGSQGNRFVSLFPL
jgi:hypothetical protein